jgi:hypothetical protein
MSYSQRTFVDEHTSGRFGNAATVLAFVIFWQIFSKSFVGVQQYRSNTLRQLTISVLEQSEGAIPTHSLIISQ